jgi:hypothetical protein
MYKGLHPRSDIHRLYLQEQEGGRGLKEVNQPYTVRKKKRFGIIWRKKDSKPFLEVVWDAKGTVIMSCHQTPRKSGKRDRQPIY